MNKVDILPNKVKLSEEATGRLRWLKTKTSLPEWTIARLGLCFSLGDERPPLTDQFLNTSGDKTKEYNRYTLTGDYDLFYAELVKTYKDRCCDTDTKVADLFRGHLNRGIIGLSKQVRGSYDLAELLAKKSKTAI